MIQFSGRLGNMIGVKRRKHYYLRSFPHKVRQSTGTRRAAQRFGLASSTAALIRKAIVPLLEFPCDGAHVNRLTKLLIPSGGQDLKILTGYRFRKDAKLANNYIAIRIDPNKRIITGTGIFTDPKKICIPGSGTLIVVNTAGEIIAVKEEEVEILHTQKYTKAAITPPLLYTAFIQKE